MQVEVSVQDCFFPNLQPATGDAEEFNSIITAQTWESWFQQWLAALSPDIPPADAYELSLRLSDDAEIQSLNSQYRQKNQPTDVLAFAALEVNYPQSLIELLASQPLYLGDIAISVETAHRQAQQHGHSLQTELAWLAAHGLLHLLGWDHPDEADLTRMLNQQDILLKMIGLKSQAS